ncbi:MAG: cytidine deaminase [Marinicellaceae bacterium]
MNSQNDIERMLISQAQEAMKKAYAPYSNYSVGAAILDENNNIHAGCNVENAAYPLGVCAEGSAISHMILKGGHLIKQILLVSSGDQLVTPCGGCRQKIQEFSDTKTTVLVYHENHLHTFTVADLLPHSFSSKHLNNKT